MSFIVTTTQWYSEEKTFVIIKENYMKKNHAKIKWKFVFAMDVFLAISCIFSEFFLQIFLWGYFCY